MNSNGLRQSVHQYVDTESCDPNAFMSSVFEPSQKGQAGLAGNPPG